MSTDQPSSARIGVSLRVTLNNRNQPMLSRSYRWFSVTAVTAILSVVWVAVAFAHDLFLRPATYFAAENSDVLVRVINGTFTKSENAITRTRLADVSVVSPGGRQHIDTAAWTSVGDTSTVHVSTGSAGTYVVGVSTKPNVLAMTASQFNAYLEEDGIHDVLTARKRSRESALPARERYAKHVKALIQVGNARTPQFNTVLGYPAELVPMQNPYSIATGAVLRVRALANGRPLRRQEVLYGGETAAGAALAEHTARTDRNGDVFVPLRAAGTWYVKFVRMIRSRADSVDYESNWATLTFQVR